MLSGTRDGSLASQVTAARFDELMSPIQAICRDEFVVVRAWLWLSLLASAGGLAMLSTGLGVIGLDDLGAHGGAASERLTTGGGRRGSGNRCGHWRDRCCRAGCDILECAASKNVR